MISIAPIGKTYQIYLPTQDIFLSLLPPDKIHLTKMLVTCQRYGDLFLFGLVWQYLDEERWFMYDCHPQPSHHLPFDQGVHTHQSGL